MIVDTVTVILAFVFTTAFWIIALVALLGIVHLGRCFAIGWHEMALSFTRENHWRICHAIDPDRRFRATMRTIRADFRL